MAAAARVTSSPAQNTSDLDLEVLETWQKSTEVESLRKSYDKILDRLLDVYVFADAHDTRCLRNDVMSAIHYLNHVLERWTGFDCDRRVYTELSESSTSYRYILEQTQCY
ncbi:hypothetical protein N0V90_001579 [Kalmusia sp. IMI 367209]|nr:hypothetical protein N0V90_001579 [Kalmusia sp. IMI 367209]